jgi:co-chaperonin GroES (HSP10)
MFKPLGNTFEIEPLKIDKVIFQEKDSLIEAGKVIALGHAYDQTISGGVNIGDIIYFQGWGCNQTPLDPEGKTHWVVTNDEKIIQGKWITANV